MTPARRRVVAGLLGTAAALGRVAPARAQDATSEALPRIVATARPSVLPVGTYAATDSPRFGFRGSGFIVGDGSLLVTNHHVLPPEADAAENAAAGRQLAVLAQTAAAGREAGDLRLARLVASDREHDLALLRIEGSPLPPLPLAAAGSLREGQAVVLMGFPIGGAFGFAPVTHRGIVASITTVALPAPSAARLDPRAVSRLRRGNFEVLQLDATAYPGNSGGPLLEVASGRVAGVINAVLVRGSRETALASPTGITYAIPVALLAPLLEEARRAPR